MSWFAARGLAAALAVAGLVSNDADGLRPVVPADCAAPAGLLAIERPLGHVAVRLAGGDALTVVAIGSSSTSGVGASSPGLSYPSRLEAELEARFPDIAVRVVNRGRGGEDAPQEVARLNRDVVREHPDLVIWQVGTNAVLHRDGFAGEREVIERGIDLLKQGGSDVVLMDMQYAPRVLARSAYPAMERLIGEAATRSRVGVFHRFEIMRHWHAVRQWGSPRMIGPDGLHMTDQGYECLAIDLAEALERNWRGQREARRLRAAAAAGIGEMRPLAASADRAPQAVAGQGPTHGAR